MQIIEVNQEKCINCGECIADCPSRLFSEKENNAKKIITFADPYASCISCGHCIGICPTDAIVYESSELATDLPKTWKQDKPQYSQLKTFLRNKRSIRRYRPEAVEETDINAILDVMKYAPSASNERAWKFMVLTDPQKIKALSLKVVDSVSLTRKLVTNFIIKTFFIFGKLRKIIHAPGFKASLDSIIGDSQAGKDPIFYGAPCVIILLAPNYGNLAGCDSGISLTYGMLAAEARGLGSCWIGIAQESLQRLPGLRKFIGIPRGYKPWGCFTLGKPAAKYHRTPPRADLSVKRN
jgi:nitroreductase/Pyruvate/2-oxoacid:ferredoxin oxidoreductase delta subunit